MKRTKDQFDEFTELELEDTEGLINLTENFDGSISLDDLE